MNPVIPVLEGRIWALELELTSVRNANSALADEVSRLKGEGMGEQHFLVEQLEDAASYCAVNAVEAKVSTTEVADLGKAALSFTQALATFRASVSGAARKSRA